MEYYQVELQGADKWVPIKEFYLGAIIFNSGERLTFEQAEARRVELSNQNRGLVFRVAKVKI